MKNSWKLVLFLFLTTSSHAADFGFGVGVKGGFPFTDALEVTGLTSGLPPTVSQDTSYIVGPVAELRLPFGFAFEVDALYRAADYQVVSAGTLPTAINSSSWEFPYLAKFRFPIPLLKPFIVAGGAYRVFNDLPSEVTPTRNAVVGGAGIELRTGRLRLSGEVRYLRWGESPENALVRLTRSQGEVLFGLIF